MADFEQHREEIEALGGRVVAVSSDPPEGAQWAVRELGLGFPIGHSLDADAAALTVGCYTGTHEGCRHVQPAGFILDPEGKVVHSVYSSGKVGRLTAADALTVLRERASAPVSR